MCFWIIDGYRSISGWVYWCCQSWWNCLCLTFNPYTEISILLGFLHYYHRRHSSRHNCYLNLKKKVIIIFGRRYLLCQLQIFLFQFIIIIFEDDICYNNIDIFFFGRRYLLQLSRLSFFFLFSESNIWFTESENERNTVYIKIRLPTIASGVYIICKILCA